MRRLLKAMLVALLMAGTLTLAAPDASPTGPQGPVVRVTTEANAGPGSLRAAINAANADPSVVRIRIARGMGVDNIVLTEDLPGYTGDQNLRIDGAGAMLSEGASPIRVDTAFTVESDMSGLRIHDLTVVNMTVLQVDQTEFKPGIMRLKLFNVHGDGSGLNGNAIFVDTRRSVRLVLDNVTLGDNGMAIMVENQGAGSVDVVMRDSRYETLSIYEQGAGFAKLRMVRSEGTGLDPWDTILVEEEGSGNAEVRLVDTTSRVTVSQDGGSPLAVIEGGAGDAIVNLRRVETSASPLFFPDGIVVVGGDDGNTTFRANRLTSTSNFHTPLAVINGTNGDLTAVIRNSTLRSTADGGPPLHPAAVFTQGAPNPGKVLLDDVTLIGEPPVVRTTNVVLTVI